MAQQRTVAGTPGASTQGERHKYGWIQIERTVMR
jgi:hypothetical protein